MIMIGSGSSSDSDVAADLLAAPSADSSADAAADPLASDTVEAAEDMALGEGLAASLEDIAAAGLRRRANGARRPSLKECYGGG